MDIARAGRPPLKSPSPSKVAYIAYKRQFCFEFNKKSPIYTEIFYGDIFLHCLWSHFVSIWRKNSLHGVQTEFSATLTDMTEPLEL